MAGLFDGPGNAEQTLAGYDGESSVKHIGRELGDCEQRVKRSVALSIRVVCKKINAFERVDWPDWVKPLR